MVLPQAGLALMHAHARRIAKEGLAVLGSISLIVESMAALVENREHRIDEIVACPHGEAHVAEAQNRRERMGRNVEIAALPVESDRSEHVVAKLPALALGKLPTGQEILLRRRPIRELCDPG